MYFNRKLNARCQRGSRLAPKSIALQVVPHSFTVAKAMGYESDLISFPTEKALAFLKRLLFVTFFK